MRYSKESFIHRGILERDMASNLTFHSRTAFSQTCCFRDCRFYFRPTTKIVCQPAYPDNGVAHSTGEGKRREPSPPKKNKKIKANITRNLLLLFSFFFTSS